MGGRADSVGTDAGQLVVDGWILDRRLGSGSYGEVWRARRRHLELVRALKLIAIDDDDAFDSWRQEISRLEELSHPNVVRFYDADLVTSGPYRGYAWIATELCDHSLLAELRSRPGAVFDDEEGERFVDQMLGALSAARSQDCVHRDIKPGNILRHASGVWKLCDFGTARLLPADGTHPLTQVIGTSPYMSAAALRGQQNHAADLYALAVTAHEALCGKLLHPRTPGISEVDYATFVLNSPPTVSPTLSRRWQTVVEALIGRYGPLPAPDLAAWFADTRGIRPPRANGSRPGVAAARPDANLPPLPRHDDRTSATEAAPRKPSPNGATPAPEAAARSPIAGGTSATEAAVRRPPVAGATSATEAAGRSPVAGGTSATEAAGRSPVAGATSAPEAAVRRPPIAGATSAPEAAGRSPVAGGTSATEAAAGMRPGTEAEPRKYYVPAPVEPSPRPPGPPPPPAPPPRLKGRDRRLAEAAARAGLDPQSNPPAPPKPVQQWWERQLATRDPSRILRRRTVALLIDVVVLLLVCYGSYRSAVEGSYELRGTNGESCAEVAAGDAECVRFPGSSDVWASPDHKVSTDLAWLVPLGLVLVVMQGLTGLTPGKLVMGLRVVGPDWRRPGLRRATIRSAMWFVDGLPWVVPLLGLVVAASRADRRRLGDLAADTYVISRKALKAHRSALKQ